MKFDFYHGTSEIFLDSIRKNGLGKINPAIDLNLLEVLKYLKKIADKHLSDNFEYLKIQQTTHAMCEQGFRIFEYGKGESKILNFRHTNTHIALSIDTAVGHAIINKYGSEILSTSILIFNLLEKFNVIFKIPKAINTFGIEQFIKSEPKRIIIKINKVDENQLDKDDGKTAKEALDFLRTQIPNMNKPTKERIFRQCNFEILYSVEPQNLTFYELEYEGYPTERNFDYTLSKI